MTTNEDILRRCYQEAVRHDATTDEFIALVQKEEDRQKADLRFNPDEVVSQLWGVSPKDLVARTRIREVVEARQVCMVFRIRNTKASLKMIGKMYGGKNHATVIYANKTVHNLVSTDQEFRKKFQTAKKIIEG